MSWGVPRIIVDQQLSELQEEVKRLNGLLVGAAMRVATSKRRRPARPSTHKTGEQW